MKRFYAILTLLLVVFATLDMMAQGTLKGIVRDFDTKEPVAFATMLAENNNGTVTDFEGAYALTLSAGSHQVKFSCLGYMDTIYTVNINDGETLTFDIEAMQQTVRLNITTVVGGKFEKELGKEIVTVDVLNKDIIANSNSYNMAAAMEKVPGVSIVDGQANIRGGSGWSYGAGSRVLVLVDEIPLLTADAADVKWSFIPTENVEQVEVVKGAASALYGSSALNGVINVRTAWPKNEPYTKVVMYTGFYQNFKESSWNWWGKNQPLFGGGNFVHRRKIGQVDLVFNGNYIGDKSYLDGGSNQEVRAGAKLRWRPKKVPGLSLGVNLNAYNSTGSTFFLWNGIDSSTLRPLPGSISNYSTLRLTIDPFITFFDKKDNRYKLNLRYFNARNKNDTGQGSVPIQYYGEFQYMRRIKKIGMDIVAGVVGRIDDVSSPDGVDTASLVGTHSGNNLGVYVQIEQTLFKKLSLAFGVRYEYFRIDTFTSDAKPLLRFGFNYQAAEATFIRGSIGQGYRFPTIAEKFVNTSIGGIGIYPNPQLEPETGWSAELGIKQGLKIKNWLGYVDLTGFINQYDNMMEFTFGQYGEFTIENLLGLGFASQNIGKTRILGAELTLIGQGKIGKIPLTILGGYTYINPTSLNWDDTLQIFNADGANALETAANLGGTRGGGQTYAATSTSEDNILKYRFEHTVKLDAQIEVKKFEFGASVNFTSFMKNIDYLFVSDLIIGFEPQIGTNAFSGLREYREQYKRGNTDLGARVGYNVNDRIKIMINAKNLLNQAIMNRPAYLSAPRNFSAQLSVVF
ncbi:MAG: TonB-dependent receptor [Chitinophagales bacterium]|nr:TonB-dependent receptor [Chitinophagales bacterium]